MHLEDGIASEPMLIKIFLLILIVTLSVVFVPVVNFGQSSDFKVSDSNYNLSNSSKFNDSFFQNNSDFTQLPDDISNSFVSEVRYDSQIDFELLSKKTGLPIDDLRLVDVDGNGLFDSVESISLNFSQKISDLNLPVKDFECKNEFVDVFVDSDGESSAFFYTRPVNYYNDSSKSFEPVDTSIVKSDKKEFTYKNVRNNVKSFFGNDGDAFFERNSFNFRSYLGDQHFSLINSDSDVDVFGNSIIYNDLYDDVDLRYRVNRGVVSEEFVLKQDMDVKNFSIYVCFNKSVFFELRDGGSINFLDKESGKSLFIINKPMMREQDNFFNISYDLFYDVQKIDNLTYKINKIFTEDGLNWLHDSNRSFPVVVDPTYRYYSDASSDGTVGYAGSDDSWDTVHDAATGTSANGTLSYYDKAFSVHGDSHVFPVEYGISRSFYSFDTSSLPDTCTVTAATVSIYGYSKAAKGSGVSIQEGTPRPTQGLSTADYDAFTGSYFAIVDKWSAISYNDFSLNSAGLSSISKTGNTLFCAREYTHDYLDSAPNEDYYNGGYFADYTGTSRDPKIVITYTYAPTIDLISPSPNGTTNIGIKPTCQIWANDTDGDSLDVTWATNESGSWTNVHTNTSVSANSTVSYNFTQFDDYDKTFYWKLYVDDGNVNVSKWFYFTTEPLNTSVGTIIPYEQTSSPLTITATNSTAVDNITLWYRYSSDNSSWGGSESGQAAYHFAHYDVGEAWVKSPEYMADGSDSTYAYDKIDGAVELLDGNNYTSGGTGTINWVHLKCRAYEMDADMNIILRPVFTGGDGDNHSFATTVSAAWYTADITNDTNAPGTWTWTDIQNLDCDVEIDVVGEGSVYCSIVQIIVGYGTTDTGWMENTTDSSPQYSWSFSFPNGTGYYEFYSIGKKSGSTDELVPGSADAICHYTAATNYVPVINSIDLKNATGSKLNNVTGLLVINKKYYFEINVTDDNGWGDVEYINITAWFDNGDENSFYNQTNGGNLNMFLQYENTTGTANFRLLWPDDETQLISADCSETIIDSDTRIIRIYFKPKNQVRWAGSNETWINTPDSYDDLYSWNFNITIVDQTGLKDWEKNEFGVYRYTYIQQETKLMYVTVSPGFSGNTNIISMNYSSNYDYMMKVYFKGNLENETSGYTIAIKDNLHIKASADPDDDITTDQTFAGIGESNFIENINESGLFQPNGLTQSVNMQFLMEVPLGTFTGIYSACMATEIDQKS